MSSHSSSASQSGFSFTGLMVLILLGVGTLGFFTLMASAQSPTIAAPAPRHIHTHTHVHNVPCCDPCGVATCTCNHMPCTCCPKPEPTFSGAVDGFKQTANRCGQCVSIEMGGARVTATGVESVRNAQLLHEKALYVRQQDFNRTLQTVDRITTAPPAQVKTVTKTVVLTVPAPPVSLIPRYTVLEPTVVLDPFGKRWAYRNYGWYLP